MKKYLLVLGMIACIFGLTACGAKESEPLMTEEEAVSNAEQLTEMVVQIADGDMLDQFKGYSDYLVLEKAVESYLTAKEDMGDYKGIVNSEATVDEEEAVVNVTVEGSVRNGVVEVIFEADDLMDYGIAGITTNVSYTFGESMGRAGLNTLLGMGTVFCVLILISLLISCFKFIAVFEEKNKKPEPVKAAPAPAPVVDAVEDAEEDLTDDLELVAVIAAAVAASEGAATTDGFVVRSIRKANKSKWQKA